MNIGLFGGTFDPIHRGHIALAQAAHEMFKLGQVFFVPAHLPPHKQNQPLTAFEHRYAMLALATASERGFLPSLLEAPREARVPAAGKQVPPPNYSVDTIRRMQQTLKKGDRLFFLIGVDAFRDIAKWHRAEALFQRCEFIVASRPGYSLADITNFLPEKLRPAAHVTKPFERQPARGARVPGAATVHVLDGIHQAVSATAIRQAVAAGKPLGRLVDPAVARYIKKMNLYQEITTESRPGSAQST